MVDKQHIPAGLDPETDAALDAFFDAARAEPVAPGDDLIARILADATDVQAQSTESFAAPVSDVASVGLWERAWATLGGWPSFGGLTTALFAGIWIGYAPPAALSDVAELLNPQFETSGLFNVMADYDVFLEEEG